MIILDTNIISEMMRPQPNANVVTWLNQQHSPDLFITSITIAEISYGLFILPTGKRKQQLQNNFEKFVDKAFRYRILDFAEQTAKVYGKVMGEGKLKGQPMSIPDGQIASIALENGYSVATRNIKDFSYCGVELINPFNKSR